MTDGFGGDIKINPRDLKDIVCEACGNYTFDSCFLLKKVPALLTGRGKEAMLPRPIFSCHACGNINREFLVGYATKDDAPAEESKDVSPNFTETSQADSIHNSREEAPQPFTLFKPDGSEVPRK